MTACVTRLLLEMGERPAVLSRGYGAATPRCRRRDRARSGRHSGGSRARRRRTAHAGASAARRIGFESARIATLAGRLAEHHLGPTVHVLDDGFQHLQLDRDVDLLIVAREDVERPLTLPSGRLREPLDTIIAADAILAADDVMFESDGAALPMFRIRRSPLPPAARRRECAWPSPASLTRRGSSTSCGRPDGRCRDTVAFPDHHPYSAARCEEHREPRRCERRGAHCHDREGCGTVAAVSTAFRSRRVGAAPPRAATDRAVQGLARRRDPIGA